MARQLSPTSRRPTGIFLSAPTVLVSLVLFSIHVLEAPFQYHLSPEASEHLSLWDALGGPETFKR